jgi:hypothetical protein
MKVYKWSALIVGIVLVCLTSIYFFGIPFQTGKKSISYPISKVPILENVDLSKIKIISKNPNFIFPYPPPEGVNILFPWEERNNLTLRRFKPINSSFYDFIAILHPASITIPRFVEQNVTLFPNKKYVLVVKMANVADWINEGCITNCSDSLIKIKIIDLGTKKEETIYEDVLTSKSADKIDWKTVVLDISKYAGKKITFRAEGYAGGPCGSWCGEYTSIDSFYIGEMV